MHLELRNYIHSFTAATNNQQRIFVNLFFRWHGIPLIMCVSGALLCGRSSWGVESHTLVLVRQAFEIRLCTFEYVPSPSQVALYSPVAFDVSITLGKQVMVLIGSLFFLSSLRTISRLFFVHKNWFVFFRPVGTLTLTPTGMRALEQARGIRGVTLQCYPLWISCVSQVAPRSLRACDGAIAPNHDVTSQYWLCRNHSQYRYTQTIPGDHPVDPVWRLDSALFPLASTDCQTSK